MTKNRFLKIATFSFLCLGMIACSQEDDFTLDTGKDTPITIASASVGDVVVTRGMGYTVDENDIMTEAESAITLYVSSEKGDKYTADKIKFKLGENGWTPDDAGATVYYEGSGSSQKFAALYCLAGIDATLDNPWESISNFPSTLTTDEQLARMDYLICNGDVTDATLDIAFKHIYAKLSFNVTYGSELEVKEIKTLTVTGLPDAVKQNIFTGEYDYEGVEFTGETKFESADYLHGLMLPYTSEKGVNYGIRVETTGNRVFTTTFQPCRKDGDDNIINYGFEAGYHYTVNLKVGLDKIEVTSVDTGESNPWTGWGENDIELN
ncbi:fimbrillin family protein [Bacteroides thetaiotaomicron]|uniref:fimbrillin family protein n=1 Tax=Bacteroides thetaiotaomicron TaxID=818 RepID=UPI001F278771|nr:fimbrillin family protein [Bacteroides thetaiotaomicron]MCE8780841.1 fimbrillin family protein [Bacteroides thetaiotaomicron]